jgi:sugar lactone lactonase YvrE
MIRTLSADVLVDAAADLGEGPTWDAAQGCLVWVDIMAGALHLTEASGATRRTHTVGEHLGAALPAEGGGWLLATRSGFSTLSDGGDLRPLLPVHGERPDLRFNDAKCDPRGRAWAGSMAYESTPGAGALYRLDHGPTATVVLDGVTVGNGLGWSPDRREMYYVDSPTQTLRAFTYDDDTGGLGSPRVVATIPADEGTPDGLCVDDDGCIWLALWDGSAVSRYTPGGRLDAVVPLPVVRPTSCCFGGGVLYITSATHGLAKAEPPAGAVFAVDAGISGPPATPWRALADV